jgi:hypothetical protein
LRREHAEADRSATIVHALRITQAAGNKFPVLRGHLGAVNLRPAARQPNPVSQVCKVGGGRITRRNGDFQQLEAPPLQRRVAIGMLGQQPGSVSALVSDQRATRPTHSNNDRPQPCGIVVVDLHNAGKRLPTIDRGSRSLIEVAPFEQFFQ